MPQARSSNRSNAGVPGVKALITAASLAATVGGWAMLSAKEIASAVTSQPMPRAPTSSASTISIELPPLPTLVPPPSQPSIASVNRKPVAQSKASQSPAAQPAMPAALRVVSAPSFDAGSGVRSAAAPAPVTNTRSSR